LLQGLIINPGKLFSNVIWNIIIPASSPETMIMHIKKSGFVLLVLVMAISVQQLSAQDKKPVKKEKYPPPPPPAPPKPPAENLNVPPLPPTPPMPPIENLNVTPPPPPPPPHVTEKGKEAQADADSKMLIPPPAPPKPPLPTKRNS
jgi:hypothetical protein